MSAEKPLESGRNKIASIYPKACAFRDGLEALEDRMQLSQAMVLLGLSLYLRDALEETDREEALYASVVPIIEKEHAHDVLGLIKLLLMALVLTAPERAMSDPAIGRSE